MYVRTLCVLWLVADYAPIGRTSDECSEQCENGVLCSVSAHRLSVLAVVLAQGGAKHVGGATKVRGSATESVSVLALRVDRHRST